MLACKPKGPTSPIDRVYWSHFVGLLWFVLFYAFMFFCVLAGDTCNVDFLHFNPHRTQSQAVFGDLGLALIFAIIAFCGVVLTFGCSQYLQAFLAKKLLQKYGIRGLFGVMIAIPVLAVVSWYCYDYLTPSDVNLGINCGPDWKPYEHGLTMIRYTGMLVCQSFVTVLSLARLVIDRIPRVIKISLMLVVLVIVPIIVFIRGFTTATLVQ